MGTQHLGRSCSWGGAEPAVGPGLLTTGFGDLIPQQNMNAASESSRQPPREKSNDGDTAGAQQESPVTPGSSLQPPLALTMANTKHTNIYAVEFPPI